MSFTELSTFFSNTNANPQTNGTMIATSNPISTLMLEPTQDSIARRLNIPQILNQCVESSDASSALTRSNPNPRVQRRHREHQTADEHQGSIEGESNPKKSKNEMTKKVEETVALGQVFTETRETANRAFYDYINSYQFSSHTDLKGDVVKLMERGVDINCIVKDGHFFYIFMKRYGINSSHLKKIDNLFL